MIYSLNLLTLIYYEKVNHVSVVAGFIRRGVLINSLIMSLMKYLTICMLVVSVTDTCRKLKYFFHSPKSKGSGAEVPPVSPPPQSLIL